MWQQEDNQHPKSEEQRKPLMSSIARIVNEDKTEDDVDNGSMLIGAKEIHNEDKTETKLMKEGKRDLVQPTQVDIKVDRSNNDYDAKTPQPGTLGEMKNFSAVKSPHMTDILQSNQVKNEDMSDHLKQAKEHKEDPQQTELVTSDNRDEMPKPGTTDKGIAKFKAAGKNKTDSLEANQVKNEGKRGHSHPKEVQKEYKRDHQHSKQVKNEEKDKSHQPKKMKNSVKTEAGTNGIPDETPKPAVTAKGISTFTAESKNNTDSLQDNQVKNDEKIGHMQPEAVQKEDKRDHEHPNQVKNQEKGKSPQPGEMQNSVKAESTTSDNPEEMPKTGTVAKGIDLFTVEDKNKTGRKQADEVKNEGHLQPKDHTHSKQTKNEDKGKSPQTEGMQISVKTESSHSDNPDEMPKPGTAAEMIATFTAESKNKTEGLQAKKEGKRAHSQPKEVQKENKIDQEHFKQMKDEDKGKSPQPGEMQNNVKAESATIGNLDEIPKPGTAAKRIAAYTNENKNKTDHLQTTKKKEDKTDHPKYQQTTNDNSNVNQQSKKTEKQEKRYVVQPTPVDTEHHGKTPKTFSLKGNVSTKTAGFENIETAMCRGVSKETAKSTAGKFNQ